ncbi:MAG: hypothetical protein AAFQ07_12625, partial [Chloroflexota bacterium]
MKSYTQYKSAGEQVKRGTKTILNFGAYVGVDAGTSGALERMATNTAIQINLALLLRDYELDIFTHLQHFGVRGEPVINVGEKFVWKGERGELYVSKCIGTQEIAHPHCKYHILYGG